MKYILVFCLITFISFASGKPSCAGCVTEADLKDAEKMLNYSLNKLAAGEDGPHYKSVKINSATKQVVSGSKHVINADLKDQNDEIKTCIIEIWSQVWLDKTQVTFNCPGEEKLVRTHSA